MTDENRIVHVVIRGHVQGVGYRAWVEDQATLSGLEGWVRNRSDGSVEAVFAGPSEDVAELLELCRKGPPAAHVNAVTEAPASADQLKLRRAGEEFSVLPMV